jgi:hypothetical protein
VKKKVVSNSRHTLNSISVPSDIKKIETVKRRVTGGKQTIESSEIKGVLNMQLQVKGSKLS